MTRRKKALKSGKSEQWKKEKGDQSSEKNEFVKS
jgi:hypothetical protein